MTLSGLAKVLNKDPRIWGEHIYSIGEFEANSISVTVGGADDDAEAVQSVELNYEPKSGWQVLAVDCGRKAPSAVPERPARKRQRPIKVLRDFAVPEIAEALAEDKKSLSEGPIRGISLISATRLMVILGVGDSSVPGIHFRVGSG